MAVETNARIEFSVASVDEWEKVNPKLHQGEPVFAKKPSGKYILKVGAPGGSTYKNAVVVWDQDDAETKMTSTQEAAAQALASKNTASASASAAKASENAAAASKSAAATSAENAKTSETNAAASKTASANSASTASAKATASANSASAASTSETNAAKSASAAATSEGNALSSANAASTSASNAKISETNAANSASAAAKSAADAAKFDPSSYYSKAEVDAKIPTKTSQLTNDAGYITKADITEGSTPDLTPYMKKTADSDLSMGNNKLVFPTGRISSGYIGGSRPSLIIDASNSVGVNIKAPTVLVNGYRIPTEADLSGKLDKTGTADKAISDGAGNVITETYATKADISGVVKSVNGTKPDSNGNVSITVSGGSNVTVDTTLSATSTNPIANKTVYSALGDKLGKTETAYAATKATQDGAGNVIATTYIKTVNNVKPDSNGNVSISGGTGGNITVDSVLSPTSTNAIQNRVVQQEFTSMRAAIPTKVSQLTNDSGYLTQHQSLDGYVKTVNNTAPDRNGNVTIALSGGGGVSTSESNTWTGKQTFQKMKFNFESYSAPRISGSIDNPSSSVAVYNVQGNFTLDMSTLAGLLSDGDATLFTAYITSNGAYTLSIVNAGTLKYVGSASDLAITTNGMILNIMLIKSSRGDLSTVVQASALS